MERKETSEAELEKGFEIGNNDYPHELGDKKKPFCYGKILYLPQQLPCLLDCETGSYKGDYEEYVGVFHQNKNLLVFHSNGERDHSMNF